MRPSARCVSCQFDKAAAAAAHIPDAAARAACLSALREAADHASEADSAPVLVWRFNAILAAYAGAPPSFRAEKAAYNRLVLSMLPALTARVRQAADPLGRALVFARTGNYIDYGALSDVDEAAFLRLLEAQAADPLPVAAYEAFLSDCARGRSLLLIADNAGEVVLDGLLLRVLHERFPRLSLSLMVRGGDVLNDATREDAEAVGLVNDPSLPLTLLDNGQAMAGVSLPHLPEDVRAAVIGSDVILSKGMANFESLSGCGLNVYYAFLCKCDLFADRFGVPLFSGMFLRERDAGDGRG